MNKSNRNDIIILSLDLYSYLELGILPLVTEDDQYYKEDAQTTTATDSYNQPYPPWSTTAIIASSSLIYI